VARARKLFLSPEACGDLESIAEPLRAVVVRQLRLLRQFPEIGVRIGGEFKGLRAATVGMFRIFYRITLRGVEVVYIRHCKRKLLARTD
jgi:plasmid stabilization system protein ParE